MEVKKITERWEKTAKVLKKEDRIYAEKLACPFIPELKLWVFWAPIFIKLLRLGISEASI
jgi:hypothetical protein